MNILLKIPYRYFSTQDILRRADQLLGNFSTTNHGSTGRIATREYPQLNKPIPLLEAKQLLNAIDVFTSIAIKWDTGVRGFQSNLEGIWIQKDPKDIKKNNRGNTKRESLVKKELRKTTPNDIFILVTAFKDDNLLCTGDSED